MKTIKIFTFFVFASLLVACKPDHSIRVTNNFSGTLQNVKVGPASYGTIEPAKTTGYIKVPEGSNTISGDAVSGTTNYTLSGSVSVSGNGEHKWTMTVKPTGEFAIAEDK